MKQMIILLIIIGLFTPGCKKDEVLGSANIFYEVAGPCKYRVKIVDDKRDILTFDSVTTGWRWQKMITEGDIIVIEASKQDLLDSVTIDYLRLYIGGNLKEQVIDTGKVKTDFYIWAKITE
jgi:hypothetical protein